MLLNAKSKNSAVRYSPPLDGLRAIAVAAVMGFHFQIPGFWGGFSGVDVFFVLSGFLITGLLVDEYKTRGTISVASFYLRRAARLMPQLAIFLFAYVLLAPWIWPSVSIAHHIGNATVALFYLSDYGIAFFGRPVTIPFTWSLAVEEHYYLIWPFVLLGLVRARSLRSVLAWLVILYCVSTAWRIASLSLTGWHSTYFRFDARISGLVAGSILAVAVREWPIRLSRIYSNAGAIASLALIAACIATSREGDAATLTWRLILIEAAAVALILCLFRDGDCAVAKVVGSPPLVFLGRISYGLYLWHAPAFFGLYMAASLDKVSSVVFASAFSLMAAWLCYRVAERPARRWARACNLTQRGLRVDVERR